MTETIERYHHLISRRGSVLVPASVILLGGALYAVAQVPLLLYIVSPAVGASALFLVMRTVERSELHSVAERRSTRRYDVLIFVALSGLAVVGHAMYPSRPRLFVVLTLTVTGLVTVRTLRSPSRLVLLELVLLGLVTRATYWFAVPFAGHDTTRHAATAGYVAATGTLIPEAITYYRWFPAAHVYGAVLSLVTGLGPKRAYFIGTSAIFVLGVCLVYLLVVKLRDGGDARTIGLLSVLILLTATSSMKRGGHPLPQTLATGILPFVLYLSVRGDDWRNLLLLSLFLLVLVPIHNFAPIFVVGFVVCHVLASGVQRALVSSTSQAGWRWPRRLGPVAGFVAVTVLHWRASSYLSMQLGRLRGLAFSVNSFVLDLLTESSGDASASGAASSQGGAAQPDAGASRSSVDVVEPTADAFANTALFFDGLDPLFRQSGEFIVQVFLLGVAGYVFLFRWPGDRDSPWHTWVLTGILLYAFFIGGVLNSDGTFTRRATDSVLLVVAPLLAFGATEVVRRLRGRGAVTLVTALLVGAMFVAATHPGVAITQRSEGSMPTVTDGEAATFETLDEYDVRFLSDGYFTNRYYYSKLSHGQAVEETIAIRNGDRAFMDVRSYIETGPQRPFVYRPQHSEYRLDRVAKRQHRIYASGAATIIEHPRPRWPANTTAAARRGNTSPVAD